MYEVVNTLTGAKYDGPFKTLDAAAKAAMRANEIAIENELSVRFYATRFQYRHAPRPELVGE